MSHFIKEIDTESEEFEIFLNDEEYYAWISQDHDYIEFLKIIDKYREEKKEIKNENNRTKKNNQKIQNRNKKIYQ